MAGILSYVIVSLVTGKGRTTVDMDQLLHRGKYAIKEESDYIKEQVKEEKSVGRLWRMIGVNSHEFSKIDKALYVYTVVIGIFWTVSFVVLLLLGFTGAISDNGWLNWWAVSLGIQLTIGIVGGIWVSIGGIFDLRKMFKRLKTAKRNELDDGQVVENHRMTEEPEA